MLLAKVLEGDVPDVCVHNCGQDPHRCPWLPIYIETPMAQCTCARNAWGKAWKAGQRSTTSRTKLSDLTIFWSTKSKRSYVKRVQ